MDLAYEVESIIFKYTFEIAVIQVRNLINVILLIIILLRYIIPDSVQ